MRRALRSLSLRQTGNHQFGGRQVGGQRHIVEVAHPQQQARRCEHELSGSRPPLYPTLKRRAESTKGAAAPSLVRADALRQPSAALPDAHALQAFSPVEPAQAGFALHSRGLMVFEEIIRSRPRRRASPCIAKGLSPTARSAYRI